MKLNNLCEKINMPYEVTEIILSIGQNLELDSIKIQMDKLLKRATWSDGVDELREIFDEDASGYKMLTCMLIASVSTYEKFREKDIDEEVFYNTFACFSRFVNEHMASYGSYGFDRDWWTPRQIAMEEFRIGELEYEMVSVEGQNVISIHIPSDSKLTKENCKRSYKEAKIFFSKYYPEYVFDKFICDSWLLSPNLKNVLANDSNILQFQSGFELIKVNSDDMEFMEWVFKDHKLPLDELPEDTSMQRKLKGYLKNGGKIGSAYGYLRENAFK